MWVRSEYAGELAVLMTWLSALLPWSVTLIADEDLTGIFFWFLPINFLFTPGVELPGDRPLWIWDFLGFSVYPGEVYVTYFWLAGTAVFLVAFGFSLAYYFDEKRVESLRFDPVRLLGTLLLASAALLAVASVLLWQNHAGITVPIGVLFQFTFGIILLKTEQVESE